MDACHVTVIDTVLFMCSHVTLQYSVAPIPLSLSSYFVIQPPPPPPPKKHKRRINKRFTQKTWQWYDTGTNQPSSTWPHESPQLTH